VHQPAPPDAPYNPFRGIPLRERTQAFEERLDRIGESHGFDTANLMQTWNQAVAAPVASESRWLHGDLHARNVLVSDGVICGIIDWGDITSGDVATDLASVWSLFEDPQARDKCLAEYEATQAQWVRAKGWAVSIGVALLDTGLVDHPRHAAMGKAILRRVREDA
jgi:aminoglycoside phosphotransferase (APT) family kinase protein